MKKSPLSFLLILGLIPILRAQNILIEMQRTERLMGSRFEFTVVVEDEAKGKMALDSAVAEVMRIEALISEWQPGTQTSAVNRAAGIAPVRVDKELYDLIYRSLKVSNLSGGAFDISFASVDKIWKFDGSMKTIPDSSAVRASVEKIGYHKIVLNPADTTVFLTESGMKIGFGAIGKGYAANRVKEILQKMGIESGVVNAGGDLAIWGKRANGGEWKIGIANPQSRDEVLAWIWVTDLAVVTSGDYERFVEFGGHRYTHIIDPKTGWPVEGLRSVSILCVDAELADALATAVFVLGPEKGLDLATQLKGVECLIIDAKGELKATPGLPIQYYQAATAAKSEQHLRTIGK